MAEDYDYLGTMKERSDALILLKGKGIPARHVYRVWPPEVTDQFVGESPCWTALILDDDGRPWTIVLFDASGDEELFIHEGW